MVKFCVKFLKCFWRFSTSSYANQSCYRGNSTPARPTVAFEWTLAGPTHNIYSLYCVPTFLRHIAVNVTLLFNKYSNPWIAHVCNTSVEMHFPSCNNVQNSCRSFMTVGKHVALQNQRHWLANELTDDILLSLPFCCPYNDGDFDRCPANMTDVDRIRTNESGTPPAATDESATVPAVDLDTVSPMYLAVYAWWMTSVRQPNEWK